MALVKISELPDASTPTGTEVHPFNQAGNTKKGVPFSSAFIDVTKAPYSVSTTGTAAANTASLLAAFAAITTAGDPTVTGRTATRALFIPNGTYQFTVDALALRSIRGLHIYGESMTNTILAFVGDGTNGLDLNGIAYSIFENFTITQSSGTLVNMINLHQGAGTAIGCTRNTFRNIFVAPGTSWVNGFALGTDGTVAVDETKLYDCVIGGLWTIGNTTTYQYAVNTGNGGTGNVLGNYAIGCNFNKVANGMHFGGTSGGAFGTGCQFNGADFSATTVNREVIISGLRSEHSQQLWRCGSGAGSGGIAMVALSDINFNTTAAELSTDGYVVDHRMGGYLRLSNIIAFGADADDMMMFFQTQGTSRLGVFYDGVAMPTTRANAFQRASASDNIDLIPGSYMTLDATVLNATSIESGHRLRWLSGSTWNDPNHPGWTEISSLVGDESDITRMYIGGTNNLNYLEGGSAATGIQFYKAGGLALQLYNGGMQWLANGKVRLYDGDGSRTQYLELAENNNTVRVALNPYVADGAAAIAHKLDARGSAAGAAALANATAKLLSVQNNGSETACVYANGDIEATTADKGVILKSANGTRYRLTVSNAGAVVVTAV